MIPRLQLFAYASLALPLACIGLPLYIYIPKYYSDHYGMPLEVIGLVLMMARLLDTMQDPYIGWLFDKRGAQPEQLRDIIMIVAPFMTAGFVLLVHPIPDSTVGRTFWLGALLVITYSSFSIVTIAYHSLATAITLDYAQQTRISGIREASGLVGVMIGAALPTLLTPSLGEKNAFSVMSMLLIPLMMILAYVTCRYGPSMRTLPLLQKAEGFDSAIRAMFKNKDFDRLMMVHWLNSIAAAIPAVLVLFFIEVVIQAKEYAGYFLVLYFLTGALGMPLWIWLAGRLGKKRAWMASMIGSVLVFVWASFLKAGDVQEFMLICALSGLCLGADLALPSAILADTLGGNPRASKHFGMLSFFSKLALALGGGIALFLLGTSGYRSGGVHGVMTISMLSLIYAILPCIIRVFAIHMLSRSHLDERKVVAS